MWNKEEKNVHCWIIMPIWEIDWCSQSHWKEVLNIIKDVVSELSYIPNLVSDSNDSWIIQKRIIQNVYNNEIVVCDVSWKNPNVMFELWMRLAFDKPTVIIKDDKTNYSFDTSVIEHIVYPRDLRYNSIIDFKSKLKDKIKSTYEKSIWDSDYSTFLKHFWEYKIVELNQKEVSSNEYILDELRSLSLQVSSLSKSNREKKISYKYNKELKNKILREYIDKYKVINNFKSDWDIFWNNEIEEELYSFLANKDIIRDLYDWTDDLRNAVSIELIPF